MLIPNWLTLGLSLAFVPLAIVIGLGGESVFLHAAYASAALLVCFTLFAVGWMGGGDAKLIAATALWLGPSPALWDYVVLSALLGGLLTVAILLLRWCMQPTTGLSSLDRILEKDAGVPYGIALGLAGLFVYASPNFPF